MIERIVLDQGIGLQCAGSASAARAVVVLQEAFGVNDHIREVTERFANAGYYALAPELFHRDGSLEVPYDNFQGAMGALGNLSREGITNDLTATTTHLNSLGFETRSIGVVGYCMGGSVAFFMNTLGLVGASVSFYGGGVTSGRFGLPSLLEQAADLRAPWLGLYGDQDQGIPVDQVEALRDAVSGSGVVTEIVRYADAQHGFHCDAREQVFNAVDAADAAARALAFLASHLQGR